MTEAQFERLIQAIEANTQAQLALADSVGHMADQCAQAIDMMAGAEDEQDDTAPALDMAGRPIKQN